LWGLSIMAISSISSVTTITPQSSGGRVTSTTTSALDNGAFIALGSNVTSISNAGGSATTTVTDYSANGTLRDQSITSSARGSPACTVTMYGNDPELRWLSYGQRRVRPGQSRN